jgi:hypothetical protein
LSLLLKLAAATSSSSSAEAALIQAAGECNMLCDRGRWQGAVWDECWWKGEKLVAGK